MGDQTRKRRLQQQDKVSSEQRISPDDDRSSLQRSFVNVDAYLTSAFAICATNDAKLATFRPLMVCFEYLGDPMLWMIGTGLLVVLSSTLTFQEKMINLFLATVLDAIVCLVIKAIVKRSRPSLNQNDLFAQVSVDHYSFPSGHASKAVMTGMFLIDHFDMGDNFKTCVIFLTFATCTSRILLGRHYLSDVLSGIVIGALLYKFVFMRIWLSTHYCEIVTRFIKSIIPFV